MIIHFKCRYKLSGNVKKQNKEASVQQNAECILIVDDDLEITDILQRSLHQKGFETCTAHSGNEAIQKSKQFAPDIVLSDIKMPNCTGIELLKNIRQVNENPPSYIFMMTGYSEFSENDLILHGADKVFQKPVSVEKLVAFVTDVLGKPES